MEEVVGSNPTRSTIFFANPLLSFKHGIVRFIPAKYEEALQGRLMRILDVGCGLGQPPVRASIQPDDYVIGIDINPQSLKVAQAGYPNRPFLCGRAEQLPFPNAIFDRLVSSVSLPYTEIPPALSEMRRVLRGDGTIFMAVHNWRFTLSELRASFLRPAACIFRIYVLVNGLIFHCTGRTIRFPNRKTECFQTRRGLELALSRAGFVNLLFQSPDGRLIVEARAARSVPIGVSIHQHQVLKRGLQGLLRSPIERGSARGGTKR